VGSWTNTGAALASRLAEHTFLHKHVLVPWSPLVGGVFLRAQPPSARRRWWGCSRRRWPRRCGRQGRFGCGSSGPSWANSRWFLCPPQGVLGAPGFRVRPSAEGGEHAWLSSHGSVPRRFSSLLLGGAVDALTFFPCGRSPPSFLSIRRFEWSNRSFAAPRSPPTSQSCFRRCLGAHAVPPRSSPCGAVLVFAWCPFCHGQTAPDDDAVAGARSPTLFARPSSASLSVPRVGVLPSRDSRLFSGLQRQANDPQCFLPGPAHRLVGSSRAGPSAGSRGATHPRPG